MPTTKREYAQAISEVQTALRRLLATSSVKVVEDTAGHMRFRTKGTVWSWGEELLVTWQQNGSGTLLTVSCEPRAQLYDWGKSQQNIDRVLTALDQHLGGRK